MQSTIFKIFSGINDGALHSEFIRYSRGIFADRYLLEGKKQKNVWSIKTGAEFANFLVRECLEKTTGNIKVSGIIAATFSVQEKAQFEIERIKQSIGIKKAVVNTETTPDKILALMDSYPKAFFALSFSSGDYQLKIKAKAPRSTKPASEREKEVSANFCSLKTSNREIINDLFFDNPDFNEARIRHTINVNEIILPKEEEDPVLLREKSIRKGKLIRIAIYDGNEKKSERDFEA